ncbi:MAG: hypothetical protein KBS34_02280 [Phascolarctobacterium sp.]|nr:hypothetical protein [Candidatus Phascolarctobacterium equi]
MEITFTYAEEIFELNFNQQFFWNTQQNATFFSPVDVGDKKFAHFA